jgi:hypothetical protein
MSIWESTLYNRRQENIKLNGKGTNDGSLNIWQHLVELEKACQALTCVRNSSRSNTLSLNCLQGELKTSALPPPKKKKKKKRHITTSCTAEGPGTAGELNSSIYLLIYLLIYWWCCTRGWTQGLGFGRQVLPFESQPQTFLLFLR